jgi:hypothetical protein
MTAEWSSSTILYAVVLLSVHVTQCPVSFKGPRSSCQLVFHQWNVSPILCCSSREGTVHLCRRRGSSSTSIVTPRHGVPLRIANGHGS